MKHYSTKELLEVNNKAPLQVQDALSSNLTITTIANIGTKLKLHIDQIGLLAELNVQMILGLVNPQEFLQELIVAKIPEKDAREIMTEINQRIFVPLREEMRKGPQTVPQIPKPVAVAEPPRTSVLSPRTTIIPANPQLPQRPAQVLAPVPRYVPPKKYFNLQNKIPPASPKATQDTAKLLEDHEEPSPSLKATEGAAHLDISSKMQGVSSPTTETPLRQALRTILPENLPGAMPPRPVVSDSPRWSSGEAGKVQVVSPPPISVPLKPSNLPLTSSAEPYSADPYREPIV